MHRWNQPVNKTTQPYWWLTHALLNSVVSSDLEWFSQIFNDKKRRAVSLRQLSFLFKLDYGVSQGSVLSPLLIAIYVDDITNCLSFGQTPLIIAYADDIIHVALSVCILQKLLYKCEQELNWLGRTINVKKSCCMWVGARCDAVCAKLPVSATSGGRQLAWVK